MSYNFELHDTHRDLVDVLRQPIRLNICATLLVSVQKLGWDISWLEMGLEMAETTLKEASKVEVKAKAEYRLARIHMYKKQWEKACERLERAIEHDPSPKEYHTALKKAKTKQKIAFSKGRKREAEMWGGKLVKEEECDDDVGEEVVVAQGGGGIGVVDTIKAFFVSICSKEQ